MYTDLKKIQVIEDLLKINNIEPLEEVSMVLQKWKKNKPKKFNIYDFVGVISNIEAKKIKKNIALTVETINTDEWK